MLYSQEGEDDDEEKDEEALINPLHSGNLHYNNNSKTIKNGDFIV